MTDPISAERAALERRAEQLEEYGQFEAVTPIYHGTAMAYDTGHPVPVSNVELYGYEKNGLVRRVASKSKARSGAQETTAEEAPPTPEDDASRPNTGSATSRTKRS